MALALAAVSAAPESGRGGVPIKYTVRFVEAEGLGWRDAVFTRLTPVTRQGAATVWTAPADVAKRLVAHTTKSPGAHLLQAPAVTAWSGAPAHIATRSNRRLVTQVAWNGDEHAAEPRPETVRTGSATTLIGRKLDQGVLVQMVIEDAQILAVHRVPLGGSNATATPGFANAVHGACQAGEGLAAHRTSTGSTIGLVQKATGDASAATGCCSDAASCTACPSDANIKKVAVEVPEIGSQEIAGEWLIPKDGILLVSFGPHTVADGQGKAIIRERLAIVEAEEADSPSITPGARQAHWPTPSYNVPVLASPSAASPARASSARALSLPPGPLEMPPPPMPPVPSRSIPQGYHRDGKAAELPPLPDDDADDEASDSAEPRPSPQLKKSERPVPTPVPEAQPRPAVPAGDTAMKKAQFAIPGGPPLPILFQPAPMVGLQFLLPVKPIWFKLPFNRRLEIEIYGRVVRNPEPAASTDLVAKPAHSEKTTK
jgi:hypothetical protein